jgi:DNA-binding MarR family transcriptional regulator
MATAPKPRRATPVREWPEVRAFRLLLRATARLTEEHRRYFAARLDLSLIEFDMIAALGNTQGSIMSDLAEAMITSPANVTRVAQAMERRGLVERRRAAHSDREVVCRLTAAGEARFREYFFVGANFTADLLSSALDGNELRTLAALLDKLVRDVRPPTLEPQGT